MPAYDDGREHDTGDVVDINGVAYEVTAVSYKEDEPGKKTGFTYTFQNADDLKAAREAERQRQIEVANQQEAATAAEAGLTPEQVAKQAADAQVGKVDTVEQAQAAHDAFPGKFSVNEGPPDPNSVPKIDPKANQFPQDQPAPEATPTEQPLPSLINGQEPATPQS